MRPDGFCIKHLELPSLFRLKSTMGLKYSAECRLRTLMMRHMHA